MKRGLGVDLLEELLARHRRREHAERAFRGAPVALGGRRSAAVRERDRVDRADLDDDRPIFSRDQSHAERRPLAWRRIGE